MAENSTVIGVTAPSQRELLEAEKIYQQGLASIRDLIAPSAMEIRYEMIRVDGLYAQSFYVFSYPRYLDMNWLSPLVNFQVSMDIAQFIYPIDSATIMNVLKRKVTQMQSSIHMDQEKGKIRDPALETALEDAEQLRTEIQRGQEKFFQFALYFTIYSDDEKKIVTVAKQLESLLGGKLVMTKRALLQSEQGFNSTLPLCLDQLFVVRNMNTSPLSTTFPFTSSTLTSDDGVLYGVNRHNDSLVIFDRFALENANSVVFAKSGAGKSYAVKLEVMRLMMFGTDVIIIDPENEYEQLAQTLGGTYLRLSLNSDRRINPFDLSPPVADEVTQPGDILRQNVITLLGLLKVMLGDITPVEEGILDKALIDVYALKGITMDKVDPSGIAPPTMEDLYSLLSTTAGSENLTQRLQKFTSGTYAGLFNKPTNVNLGTGLMVFCIRDLDESLRPIAMYIILNYIWSQIRRELKKRIMVIDEAWSLMQHGDSARFLFGLVKRARKYYLGISTITQDVEDFLKSEFGKPIITNSSMQLLLKQAPAAVDLLAQVFNLTEGEKYILLNSGVGQGLFFAGNKHAAIQVIASYGEDQVVTTNPEQLLAKKKVQEGSEQATSTTL
jgi:type IV secretory pathway VirB4 component